MKKIKFLATLLAAGALVACNETIEPQGSGENTPTTGEGYVKVAINMPTTSGDMTKADDNQDSNPDIDFEDGSTNEYKINDGIIVFFKSTTEETNPDAKATFVSAYNLRNLTTTNDPSDQVTERVATVTEAPMVSQSEQLYALVILNTPSFVTVDENTHEMSINTTELKNTHTLTEFTKALTGQDLKTYTGTDNNDFTMSNAPLSTEDGLDNDYTSPTAKTLVPVTVYETQEAAESSDAARIYVERVAAKVTLKGFGSNKQITVTSNGVYNGDIVTLMGWALNVTNKSTSLVRNVEGFKASTETDSWLAAATSGSPNHTSRFAGTSVIPVDYNGTNYYRIYWAKDGNYDSYSADDFNIFSTNEENGNIIPEEPDWNTEIATGTDDNALYCLENTMDASQQLNNNTTTVVLKTTYSVKFDGQAEAKPQDFFICGTNPTKHPKDQQGTQGICAYVTTQANNRLADGSKIGENDLTLKTGIKSGRYASLDEIKKLFNLDNETDEKWNAIWNEIGTIKYYQGGVAYYYDDIFIRHFTDTETPWSDGQAYGIEHLGRYGVVRNNWYEIKVTSISGPGEPVIDEPGTDPNDDAEAYISCEINVLSWAKRSQDVDL